MKTLFIPVYFKRNINASLLKKLSDTLPKKISIAYSIQFKPLAEEIKSKLKKSILSFNQVLGCSKPKFPKQTEAILLIGSGRFHAISLFFETGIPVFILEGEFLHKISEKDVEELRKSKKGAMLKYLNAENVGILISTKPGQENLEQALKFKSKLKNKKAYLFLSNQINSSEFENFPQINSWINTACRRLDLSIKNILNISDITH